MVRKAGSTKDVLQRAAIRRLEAFWTVKGVFWMVKKAMGTTKTMGTVV